MEVSLGLLPGLEGDEAAEKASRQIGGAEVDASVTSGNSGLVGGVREPFPGQGYRTGRCNSRFNLRAACGKSNGVAEAVASVQSSRILVAAAL